MTKSSFIDLFKKANLNNEELQYFMEDAEDAINNMTDIESAEDYYDLAETQFCVVNYAKEEYKSIAKSGLQKIVNIIY